MKRTAKLEKMAEEFLNDGEQHAWETGKLGRNVKHMRVAPEKEIKKFLEAKEAYLTSIRLSKELVANLRILAKKNGLNYQTYLKMLLTRHVRENMKKTA